VTFDADGLVVTEFAQPGSAGTNAVVVQPDGRLVAAGGLGDVPSSFALARYNPNGSLDTTFGEDGRVVTGFPPTPGGFTFSAARGLVLQPDGRLVVAGNTTNAGNCRFALARYNPDGSLDATFDGDGIATAPPFVACQAHALALQTDGKLVAAGSLSNNPFGSEFVFGLARFNPDGSLDPTFDGDGIATANFFIPLVDGASALVVQPDGRLVAAGGVGALDGFALARFEPDGSLDASFDGDGLVVTGPPVLPGRALALVLQPDAKLVAAGFAADGEFGSQFALARYNADGSLDTSFGGDGVLETDFPSSDREFAGALVLQADGRLVAAGMGFFSSPDGFGGFALARYQGDIVDVTPPVVGVPAVIAADAMGPNGAVVDYQVSATDDQDPSPQVICSPVSGSTFPIGTTTVTCTATDASGNSATATFEIVVKGASEQLLDLVAAVKELHARPAVESRLVRRLQNALDALASPGHKAIACTELDSFIREVRAQAGRAIGRADADRLVVDAQRIKAVIGCP
jgi:uncharacterized delta-60 repeat protein